MESSGIGDMFEKICILTLFPLRFRGYFEEDSSNPGQYDFTMAFWHILAAKLAFVVIFEVLA